MKTQHTPGPWIAHAWKETGVDLIHIRQEKEFTNLIATTHRWQGHINKREAVANGKLIAAAPELLEACQMALQSEIDGSYVAASKWWKLMEEAVKKATP